MENPNETRQDDRGDYHRQQHQQHEDIHNGRQLQQQQQQQEELQPPPPSLNDLRISLNEMLTLQEDELHWAHQIKQAINLYGWLANHFDLEAESGVFPLRPICDYDIAQWAIATIERRNLRDTLEGIYKLQCFREQYNLQPSATCTNTTDSSIDDTVEEGAALLKAFMDLQPGFILAVEHLADEGYYVLIMDCSAFNPAAVQTPEQWRAFLAGYFYLMQVMNNDFKAAREGTFIIAECRGFGFRNYHQRTEERSFDELMGYYPTRYKRSNLLYSSSILNVLLSCVKPFMSAEHRESFSLGCTLNGYDDKISALFQAPTLEVAQAKLLEQLKPQLKKRAMFQAIYCLPGQG